MYLVHINKGKDLHQNKPKVHQHFLPVPSTKKKTAYCFVINQAHCPKCTELLEPSGSLKTYRKQVRSQQLF